MGYQRKRKGNAMTGNSLEASLEREQEDDRG